MDDRITRKSERQVGRFEPSPAPPIRKPALSQRRKTILWLGALVIVGMGICPPFQTFNYYQGARVPADVAYHWLWDNPGHGSYISFSTLLLQWFVAAVAATAAFFKAD